MTVHDCPSVSGNASIEFSPFLNKKFIGLHFQTNDLTSLPFFLPPFHVCLLSPKHSTHPFLHISEGTVVVILANCHVSSR